MQKLSLKTPNKTAQHIDQIAELFPNVMSEGKVDFDLLRQMLSEELVEESDERYRLDWVGKKASLLKANRSIDKTLRPCVEESVNFESTENLYIEGDNFEVLKLIQESYLNKVKMIYIDPPYNTGKDFVYRDNFTKSTAEYEKDMALRDEEENKLFKNTDSNGRFHSDWLSMMYERLLVSRDLLKDDGVIFISIDDNEVHNLRKICDEVFGESNFVNEIIWKKRVSPANDSQWYSSDHEYILVYAKNKNNWFPSKTKRTKEHNKYYKNLDNDPKGAWNSAAYTCNKSKKERPNLYYPIIHPTTGEEIYPSETAVWAYSKETHLTHLRQNLLYWGSDGKSKAPRKKQYLFEAKPIVPRSIWDYAEVGSTQTATLEIKKLFEKNSFSYPKSLGVLKKAIYQGMSNDEIILDFFSGSATTAHAVMQLNAEDQGNRKFIMVQLPEKTDNEEFSNICEIGKERIRRAGAKINDELTSKNEKLVDIGFRVLKLDSSNMKDVYYHPTQLRQQEMDSLKENIKTDRDEMDLLFSTMLDLGIELSLQITPQVVDGTTLYVLENGELVACFADNISVEVIEAIKTLSPLQVVLKDGCFANDSAKINGVESLSKVATVSVL